MESDDKSSTQRFEENSILDLQKMSAENQHQLDIADSLINNSVIQAIVDKFNIDNFAKNHPLADDIENGVKELIKENNTLKDTLITNNDSKIRQYGILEKVIAEAQSIHKSYKRKLDEAQNTIEELKAENVQLRKPLQEMICAAEMKFHEENKKLRQDNQQLREKNFVLQRMKKNQFQTTSDNETEVYRISKKLEESERERRKLALERDRFLGQELKLQQILGAYDPRNVTNLCYWNYEFPDVIISGQKESQLKEEVKEFDKILQSEVITFSQANPIPELSSLNVSDGTKDENSVKEMAEEILALRKQVLNERAVCTLCRKLLNEAQSKFRVIHKLTLDLLKDHESKIRALEITLVKAKNDIDFTALRHELSDKQNRIVQLETDLMLMKEKLEEANKMSENYYILQSQMKVYEEDFLSMRSEKDALASDKHLLEHKMRFLTQENAKLKKELRVSGESDINNSTNSEQSASPPYQYKCINETCQQSFASEEELQTHIYCCLNLKD